jgi:hypothetical protein
MIRLNDEMIKDSKKLILDIGLPVIQAPSEGEAQCSYMAKVGDAYAVSSQDYDSLLFGAPRLIQNMTLASSETYSIKLTFTFADGKYQSYSQSYTTPQFQGQAQVTSSSLTLGHLLVEFSLTMKNTGNLPITNVNCMVANQYQALFIIKGGAVIPGDTITGGWTGAYSSVSAEFQAGTAYSVKIQLTYADGSTSTIQTSVIAQS